MGSSRAARSLTPYLFLLPAAVLFLAFTLVPILVGFGISFFKWNAISAPAFIGAGNWAALLRDEAFGRTIVTTFIFTAANTGLGIVLGIALAALVDAGGAGHAVYRTIFFTPVVTSAVAMSFIARAMFKSETGVINYLLGLGGIHGPHWLETGTSAVLSVIMFSVWLSVGNNMLLFLAGLQSIPDSLYEAARVDGANWPQSFRRITLPMLSPTIFFVLIISLIGNAQLFDPVYTLTKGGPGYATVTMVYSIYSTAYLDMKMGYSSAQAIVLFLIIMLLTQVQWKYQGKWVHYE